MSIFNRKHSREAFYNPEDLNKFEEELYGLQSLLEALDQRSDLLIKLKITGQINDHQYNPQAEQVSYHKSLVAEQIRVMIDRIESIKIELARRALGATY